MKAEANVLVYLRLDNRPVSSYNRRILRTIYGTTTCASLQVIIKLVFSPISCLKRLMAWPFKARVCMENKGVYKYT